MGTGKKDETSQQFLIVTEVGTSGQNEGRIIVPDGAEFTNPDGSVKSLDELAEGYKKSVDDAVQAAQETQELSNKARDNGVDEKGRVLLEKRMKNHAASTNGGKKSKGVNQTIAGDNGIFVPGGQRDNIIIDPSKDLSEGGETGIILLHGNDDGFDCE